MRQGHFAAMFFIIYVVCFLFLMIERTSYDRVMDEKQRVEKALLEALESTAQELSKVIYESPEKKKQVIENVFQESLFVSLGIFGEEEEQEKLKMYLPMIVLAEEDGAQFYYIKEVKQNDVAELNHVWSDKISFSFSEETIESKKKALVAEVLEKKASEIITDYNYIAAQYGLKYSFYVPDFLQNMEETLEFPMLFIVFQGWPLNLAGDIVYENCIDAGGYLQEVEQYVVEIPVTLEETFAYYHQQDCPIVMDETGCYLDEYMAENKAISTYGALPCGVCID